MQQEVTRPKETTKQRRQQRKTPEPHWTPANRVNEPANMTDKRVEDTNMSSEDEEEKKDLTFSDVPSYDEDGEDDVEKAEEKSIRDMIMAMRTEFRSVGRKVDAFEKTLGSTKNKVERLTTQVRKIERKQEDTLQQLKQQILKELDDKV